LLLSVAQFIGISNRLIYSRKGLSSPYMGILVSAWRRRGVGAPFFIATGNCHWIFSRRIHFAPS
jgi:hypothetical protein